MKETNKTKGKKELLPGSSKFAQLSFNLELLEQNYASFNVLLGDNVAKLYFNPIEEVKDMLTFSWYIRRFMQEFESALFSNAINKIETEIKHLIEMAEEMKDQLAIDEVGKKRAKLEELLFSLHNDFNES